MTEIPPWVGGYVGLPYAAGGRDRTGLDCWGLMRLVLAEQFGVAVPAYAGAQYRDPGPDAGRAAIEAAGRDLAGLMALDEEWRCWAPVAAATERPGDVVLLRVLGQPVHVGVVVAPGWMLHIERGCGAVAERYRERAWARRVVGIYRHWGMPDA